MKEEIEFYVGSGNVFADLGLPNPEECQLKAYLIMEIEHAIRDEKLTKVQAAQKLGLSRHEFSELLEGALSQYSVNQLIQYLNCLNRDVTLFASVQERAPEAKNHARKVQQETVAA